MTQRVLGDPRIVGPVMQFALLLIPVVMNGFYMVYALTGWILQGRDKLNWSLEAESVSLWVGSVVVLFSVLVMAWVHWRGGQRYHPLMVSGYGHCLIAILLTVSVFVTVRL